MMSMQEEEWVEFKINCGSLLYKHPSGTALCLDQPKSIFDDTNYSSYHLCLEGFCPILKEKYEKEK